MYFFIFGLGFSVSYLFLTLLEGSYNPSSETYS